MSIRRKLILLVTFLTFLTTGIFTVFDMLKTNQQEFQLFTERRETNKKLMPGFFEQGLWTLDGILIQIAAESLLSDSSIVGVKITNISSRRLAPGGFLSYGISDVQNENGIIDSVELNYQDTPLGTVNIYYTLEPIRERMMIMFQWRIIAISLLLIVQILSLIPLSLSMTKPLIKMANKVSEIGKGQFDTNIEITGSGVVGELAQALISMQSELKLREEEIIRAYEKVEVTEADANQEREKANREEQLRIQLEESIKKLQDTQKKLVQSERISLAGRLATGLAHEVNTPLGVGVTAISHVIQLLNELISKLKEKKTTSESVYNQLKHLHEVIVIISNNIDKVVQLMNSFRLLRELEAPITDEYEKGYNIKKLIRESITSWVEDHPAEKLPKMEIILQEKQYRVRPKVLQRVIQSIFSFTSSDMEQSGINYSRENSLKIELTTIENKPNLEIIYINPNCKWLIDTASVESVFEPFYSGELKGKGSGLMLFFAYILTTLILDGKATSERISNNGLKLLFSIPMDHVLS